MRERLKYALPVLVLGLCLVFAGCINKPVSFTILHVNDLHSNFDHGRTPDLGGYAQVKAQLDALKAQAVHDGRQVLALNGGDSFEGHPYYFASNGSESVRLLGAMKFDATVIANHDILAGPVDFDRLVGEAPAGTNLISGNIGFDASKYPNLARNLKPYVTFKKGGLNIAVIGLTTNSPLYAWAVGDVKVQNPIVRAQELVAQVRAQSDIVIVLSHLGTADDVSLVEHTAGIDLVVGAHDHIPLLQPLVKKNLLGKNIPILQSQPFGEGIGELKITVKRDRTYTIDGYRIVPVPTSGPKDATVASLVAAASSKLDQQLTPAWLDEKVADSTIALENDEDKNTALSQISAEALREAAKADIALDFGEFHGMTQAAGPVTRRTLLLLYPRRFEFAHTGGWTVWTMQLPGALVTRALGLATSSGFKFAVAGDTSNLDPVKIYTIALPEGIARGLVEIPKLYEGPVSTVLGDFSSDVSEELMTFVLRELAAFDSTIKDTGVPIWSALESRMRELQQIRPDNL